MSSFEKEIAYFYGVKETSLVAKHYLEALASLKENVSSPINITALTCLTRAYKEVRSQTGLTFDPSVAAKWEYSLTLPIKNINPLTPSLIL